MKATYSTFRRTDKHIRKHFAKYDLPDDEFMFIYDDETGYILGFKPITNNAILLNKQNKYEHRERRQR